MIKELIGLIFWIFVAIVIIGIGIIVFLAMVV